jgi:hypothetical protein
MTPEIGKRYSREQINLMLGGETVSYLPMKDGAIVAGCFKPTPRWNLGAPTEVVFGVRPHVRRAAELVSNQQQAIPVFLFRRDAEWEYVGHYQCCGIRTDAAACRDAERRYPKRGKIGGVLKFRRVGA